MTSLRAKSPDSLMVEPIRQTIELDSKSKSDFTLPDTIQLEADARRVGVLRPHHLDLEHVGHPLDA